MLSLALPITITPGTWCFRVRARSDRDASAQEVWGDYTYLQNGNLDLASATALGAATNKLIVNPGSNSLRVNSNPTSGLNPVIGNDVVLNSWLTFTSYDGGTSTFTGNRSGAGGPPAPSWSITR